MAPLFSTKTPLRVLFLVVVVGLCAVSAKKTRRSLIVHNAEPAEQSVYDRNIVTEHIHYKSILFEHSRHWSNVSHRHFRGNVLGYITPWNSKGYDIAVKFRNKFTHISPVWYQLRGLASGPELGGRDGVDTAWIKRLKADGATVKLVPRFNIEGSHVKEMISNPDFQSQAIELIMSECLEHHYDGLVLEAWSSWAQAGVLDNRNLRAKAITFVKKVAAALESQDVILVISPPGHGGEPGQVFSANDVVSLAPHVAGFSLMTYDFSNAWNPGPNAPLKWVQTCLMYLLPHLKPDHIEAFRNEHHYGRELRSLFSDEGDEIAAKILLGLNFYGNKFQKPQGGGPIVGHEYLELVDKHRPSIKWDDTVKEHHFQFTTDTGTKFEVYYPSLKSIAERLEEAQKWGAGISIWELGQGLDYFYDLL